MTRGGATVTVAKSAHVLWTPRTRAGLPVFTDADLEMTAMSGASAPGPLRGSPARLDGDRASSRRSSRLRGRGSPTGIRGFFVVPHSDTCVLRGGDHRCSTRSRLRGSSTKASTCPAGSTTPSCSSQSFPIRSRPPRRCALTARLRHECLSGAIDRREPYGVWGGQLVVLGAVVARKRPRGRPRKEAA